jgi:hypothetical protein
MLGPLPRLYRWVVGIAVVLTCIGIGAWLGFTLPVRLEAAAGAWLGAALGALLLAFLLHDRTTDVRAARVRDRPRSR